MLSSFGRNGLVERYSWQFSPAYLTRHQRTSGVLHCGRRNASRLSTTHSDRGLRERSLACPAAIRLLSTTPPGTTKPTNAKPSQPIPPTPPASRKHKVVLNPAPVKSPRSPSTEPTSLSSKPSTSEHAKSTHTDTSSTVSTSVKSDSVIEVKKHDYEDASQHGILAPPPENTSWAGKLYHQVKELFKFYWRGIKLINTNRRRAREMQERVRAGGPPLTRWETRFIRTHKQDVLKLVPFLMIILIAEEVIPLVVLYAPGLLPSTCLLPSQKERIDAKRREKQKMYLLDRKPVFEQVRQRILANPDVPISKLLDNSAVIAVNGLLSLSTSGPSALRLRRLQRHLAVVAQDDALLKGESLGGKLTKVELRDALEERGLIAEGSSPKVWRSRLEWWLTHVDREGVRPSGGIDSISQRVLLVVSSGAGKF
ncbi:hypothetical protein AcW1_003802 [Taiwanofungus camphoratus]|nr:hypothetical protein AcV5_003514 [Antrodia cinnamomea]KAI0940667.1 hypothetical protein AcW1_003802 [Antrodia cinnamomea]KAI0958159.1 hypothetical protein AcV7_004051 [Antrodia cinnamomea]